MSLYDWFENDIQRVRRFSGDFGISSWRDAHRKLARKITYESRGLPPVIRGSHVMNAPKKSGFALIEEEFGIELPDDMREFYSKWDGGLLFLGLPYCLWSCAEIIENNNRIRDAREDGDCEILRFGQIATGKEQVAMCMLDEWRPIYATLDYSDDDFLNEEFGPISDFVLASCFSEWLKRTVRANGEMPGFFEPQNELLK